MSASDVDLDGGLHVYSHRSSLLRSGVTRTVHEAGSEEVGRVEVLDGDDSYAGQ
jgi:hypothetical protein